MVLFFLRIFVIYRDYLPYKKTCVSSLFFFLPDLLRLSRDNSPIFHAREQRAATPQFSNIDCYFSTATGSSVT